jgi:hypothetical protein
MLGAKHGGDMDKRTSWLMAAGVGALAGAFTMAVRGPEYAVFLFLMAAACGLRAQNAQGA